MDYWFEQSYFQPKDTRAKVEAGLQRLVEDLGLEHYFHGVLRPPYDLNLDCVAATFASYPQEFLDRYIARNYFQLDPVCDLARRDHRPFFWGEGRFLAAFREEQRQVIKDARDFGIVSGLAIPVHSATGAVSVFSVAAADPKRLREAVRGEHERLFAVALDVHDSFLKAAEAAGGEVCYPPLSIREKECLAWTLEGKTAAEIGSILNLSSSTVNRHAGNATRKLDCLNKHHAAVRALRHGLL